MSWHRAGKADKTPHCIPATTTHNIREGLQSALPGLGGGAVDGDLFRTPLSMGMVSRILSPASAGPGSCERGRPDWQWVRGLGGLAV